MLSHSFIDMPGNALDKDGNPCTPEMMLRCSFCFKTPTKAREDGCPSRELQEVGAILLSEWNPEGVAYFNGRTCVTCEMPIMGHWLRRGQREYWCHANQNQFSYGVNGCIHDVSDVRVPAEKTGTLGSVQL